MPARPLEGHAISPAPDEGVRQAHSVPVDRHKAIDGAFQRLIENRLDAAQVAESLLTDVSHEGDRPRRLNVRLIQDARDGQEHRQTPAVIANPWCVEHSALAPHPHVGPLRKHRIEMGGDNHMGMERHAGPVANHVARLVAADVPQACLLKQPLHFFGARGLFERGRWNLGEPNLSLDRLRLAGLRRGQCRFHRRILCQQGYDAVRRLLRLHRQRGDDRSEEHREHHPYTLHVPNSIQSNGAASNKRNTGSGFKVQGSASRFKVSRFCSKFLTGAFTHTERRKLELSGTAIAKFRTEE